MREIPWVEEERLATPISSELFRLSLGADKGYDVAEFIEALTQMKVLPHVAQNTSGRRSAVPDSVAKSDGGLHKLTRMRTLEQIRLQTT